MTSPTFSSFASNAFLPSRGMHFDGSGATRVYDWKTFRAMNGGAQHAASTQPAATQPASTQPAATQPGSTQPAATQAPPTTAGATQPTEAVSQDVSSASAAPTTASGYLRPGSIDQNQFKAMLAAASLGTPGKPAAGMPAGTGLSPMPAATGRSPLAPVNALAVQQASTGLPMPGAAVANSQAPAMQSPVATPGGAAIPTLSAAQFAALTGAHLDERNAAGNGSQPPVTSPASGNPGDHGMPPDALTMTDAAIPPDAPPVALDGQAAALPSTDKSGDDKDEDGVLKLTQIPDRETRQEYAAKGIKWKLVDDPAADQLFFGPDGKLSWDDAVDLINPLQHIPGINILYRQLTGDKISGAAELLGAIPFGPLSTLGAVVNLAVKSTSGRDIGDNLVAMLTGEGKSETKTTDLAAREPQPAATAATGETAEIAGETAGPAVPAEVELASAYSVRDHTYGRG